MTARGICGLAVIWLIAGCASSNTANGPRRLVRYVFDRDSRAAYVARRSDAIRQIEQNCESGYRIVAERPPGRRRRTGVIEYVCNPSDRKGEGR